MKFRCPTPYAVLLLAVRGEDGVYRFPSESDLTPGLVIQPKPLLGIFEQLSDRATEALGLGNLIGFDVRQDFAEPLENVVGEAATLFVASYDGKQPLAKGVTLTPLPHLIRAMGRHRNRVSYLKAWQVLSGAASERTVALEAADLGKYLD